MRALDTYQMFIDGQWCDAADGTTYDTLNPFDQQPWAQVPDAGSGDVDRAVAAAKRAFDGPWGQLTGFERAAVMRRLADLIQRDARELASLETSDNGKLLRETRGQLEYIPTWYRYFSSIAETLQGDTIPSDRKNFFVYTRREPLGVVAAIVPWNSPMLLAAVQMAPALAAGCTIVLKPSDYTPVTSLKIAALFDEAGFPPGVVNVITGRSTALSEALVAHPDVAKVTFTGSPAVGALVAAAAGRRLAPVLLELGGKSAQVVFSDADLDAAANGVLAGIFAATGQTCVAGSRLVVHKSVKTELVERIVERARTIRLGDPKDPETEMGPLANEQQLKTVTGFVERAAAAGASVVSGGRTSSTLGGLFFEPTVVTGVSPQMEIAQHEIFGPILAVLEFEDEAEAIDIANSTPYGLAAGVWTRDVGRAHRVSHALRAGNVWINAYRIVAPNVPFGGSGASGWGRVNGADAVKEFTRTKAVWVELEGATRDPFVMG